MTKYYKVYAKTAVCFVLCTSVSNRHFFVETCHFLGCFVNTFRLANTRTLRDDFKIIVKFTHTN